MIAVVILLAVVLAGCSSPTTPTPIAPPVVAVPPAVTPSPAPVPTPTPNPLLSDPRFSLAFYRQFVLNGYESPGSLFPLRRHEQAPLIYLFTVDDAGAPIDTTTLNMTAAALENVAGVLTGRFGLEGIMRGTGLGSGPVIPNLIVVRWSASADPSGACGRANVGGKLVTLYPRSRDCACGGSSVSPLIVKHELGHALGYWHTDNVTDLMRNGGHTVCDMNPSAREMFHAQVAYSQPIGSLDPF